MIGDLAFLLLEVLLVVVIIERLLARREMQPKLEKLDMVVGALGWSARLLTICLCQIALLSLKSGFISQDSTDALEQGRMRIVEKNVKGMGHQV